MTNDKMDINRENAMTLWNERYGKALKVKDFAGREMAKGAYGDRNSEYGWNLDHILPQSQGGKDTPSNLICCHILTNDDKADKFPTFVANGKRFEILKVQNHYEIKEIKESNSLNEKDDDSVDFFDPSAAMRFLEKCKNGYFVGEIKIHLNRVSDCSIIDFIREMYSEYEISIRKEQYSNYTLDVMLYDLPLKEDIQNALDICVMAHTYLQNYFLRNSFVDKYDIFFGVKSYKYHIDDDDVRIEFPTSFADDCTISINELVKINTDAKDKNLEEYHYSSYYKYSYTFEKLEKKLLNLGKDNK